MFLAYMYQKQQHNKSKISHDLIFSRFFAIGKLNFQKYTNIFKSKNKLNSWIVL